MRSRKTFLLSIISVIAIVISFVFVYSPAPAVSAYSSKGGSTYTGPAPHPTPVPPWARPTSTPAPTSTPRPTPTPHPIDNLLDVNAYIVGGPSLKYGSYYYFKGQVSNLSKNRNVQITITLYFYYTSYSAGTLASYSTTVKASSKGTVDLSSLSGIQSKLALNLRSPGNYRITVTASQGVRGSCNYYFNIKA